MNKLIAEQLGNIAKLSPQSLIESPIKGCKNISYENFEDRINNLAKGFLLHNITPKSKVLLFLSYDRYSVEAFIALTKIGASIYTTKQTSHIKTIIQQNEIATILLPFKTTIELFDHKILAKQNRDNLRMEVFKTLQTIVLLDPIKLRGAFNIQELILLGKHIDDTDIETIIMDAPIENYSILKAEIKNNLSQSIKIPIDDLFIEKFPFFDWKKL